MIAAASLSFAGCGSDAPAKTAAAQPATYLPALPHDLERELGSTFSAGLDRLAVMTQPTDDASDLGQSLPTGTLRSVRCTSATKKPAGTPWDWDCDVKWRTVNDKPKSTSYRAQVTGKGCVYANADPPLDQVHDATTNAPAEHPLSILTVPKAGC